MRSRTQLTILIALGTLAGDPHAQEPALPPLAKRIGAYLEFAPGTMYRYNPGGYW